MTTEQDVLELLHKKYTKIGSGSISDQWIRSEYVRATQNYMRRTSMADFIAINKQASTQKIIGHEIHTSRSTWLKEVKFFKMYDDVDHDFSKSSLVKKYCNQWFLVVSGAEIVKDNELPQDWGMMAVHGNQLKIVKKAPVLSPEPLSLDFATCLLESSIRTANRSPYFRDADSSPRTRPWSPTDKVPSGVYEDTCVACGHSHPCPLHQPRAYALENRRNQQS